MRSYKNGIPLFFLVSLASWSATILVDIGNGYEFTKNSVSGRVRKAWFSEAVSKHASKLK